MEALIKKKGSCELQELSVGSGRTEREVLISYKEAPNFALRRFVMEPGASIPLHTNTVEHEQFIVSGGGTVFIDGKKHEVSAGDAVYIPKNVPHSYQADPKEGFEFICVVPNEPDEMSLVES